MLHYTCCCQSVSTIYWCQQKIGECRLIVATRPCCTKGRVWLLDTHAAVLLQCVCRSFRRCRRFLLLFFPELNLRRAVSVQDCVPSLIGYRIPLLRRLFLPGRCRRLSDAWHPNYPLSFYLRWQNFPILFRGSIFLLAVFSLVLR